MSVLSSAQVRQLAVHFPSQDLVILVSSDFPMVKGRGRGICQINPPQNVNLSLKSQQRFQRNQKPRGRRGYLRNLFIGTRPYRTSVLFLFLLIFAFELLNYICTLPSPLQYDKCHVTLLAESDTISQWFVTARTQMFDQSSPPLTFFSFGYVLFTTRPSLFMRLRHRVSKSC